MILNESRIRVYDRNLITRIFNGYKQALHSLRSEMSDYQLSLWIIQSQLGLELPKYKLNQINFIIDKVEESLKSNLHIITLFTYVYELCVKNQINDTLFLEHFYNQINENLDINFPLGIFSSKANADSRMVTQSPLLATVISVETKNDRVKFELKLTGSKSNRQVFIVHTPEDFVDRMLKIISNHTANFLDEVLHSEMFTSCHNFNSEFNDPAFKVIEFNGKHALEGIVKWDLTKEKNLRHLNLPENINIKLVYAVDPRHELIDTTYYAYYDTNLQLVCLNLNVSDYNSDWHATIEHELIHYMQFEFSTGWPSKKAHTYSYNPEEISKYGNRLEEYWPLFISNVRSTIDELQNNGYPKKEAISYIGNKILNMYNNGSISQQVFRGYLKEALKYIDSDYIEP